MTMRILGTILLLGCIGLVNVSLAEVSTNQENWEEWDNVFKTRNAWELLRDKKGIKVYARSVAISPIRSFRGVMTLDVDLHRLIAQFMDIKSYPTFMSLCYYIEELKQSTETEKYLYSTYKIIWPVKKRDSSVFTKWFYYPETGAVELKLKNKPNNVQLKEDFIRVPILMGYYKFTPKSDGKVEVVYEALADVGGWVPKWVINFYLEHIPYRSLSNIRDRLPLDKYKGPEIDLSRFTVAE